MPMITAWTALICAVFYMLQTAQVIRARGATKVSLGDGGDKMLLRRVRGQANAAEQMPITLIVLGLCEMMGGAGWLLGLLAAVFTLGRIAHGVAFGWLEHSPPLRMYGMIASVTGTIGLLVYLFVLILGASVG